MAEKKKKENDISNQKAQDAMGARRNSGGKRKKTAPARSEAPRAEAQQRPAERGTSKRGSGAKKTRASVAGEERSKRASRSSLFDFPDITPDADDITAAGNEVRTERRRKKSDTGDGAERKNDTKLRVIPLGGLGEIGKNMTAIEYGQDIVVIDCGMGFPEEDMPGIDLVIPDITYLTSNREKVRGILLTHGHEDHIGAVPYVLKQLNVPIWGTALTIGIIKNKLSEHRLDFKPQLNTVKAGDKVRLGVFEAEFIHVNHSIADSCAIALSTPRGLIVHSGDFKLDVTPIEGEMMDLTRFGELGKKGVKLLMCESTNAERSGFTPSERSVGGALENLFTANPDKRIVIATFSSNVHRVQQIINISIAHGRRVALTGR